MSKLCLVIIITTILVCAGSSRVSAQERVEAGVFVDYLNISQTNTDNYGLGARLGVRFNRFIVIEGGSLRLWN